MILPSFGGLRVERHVFAARSAKTLALQSIRVLDRREDSDRRRERGGRSGQGNVGQGNGYKAVSWIPLTPIPLTSASVASNAGSGVPL